MSREETQPDTTGNGAEQNQPAPSGSANGAGAPTSKRPYERHMLVRYGKMGALGLFRHEERHIPLTARYVVINTERGLELGEMVSPYFHHRGTCDLGPDRIMDYCRAAGGNYPITRKGRFERFANDQDLNEQRHLEQQAQREKSFCAELIAKHNLAMKLVEVEHLFGGDRIIYYFMADGRVDFRQLVKELAHEYQTRIEMRQVGARDEARLVADFETCGRECCCKNFLKVLQPVNMRMAKLQKATLDPTKISGRCGRLKCCLRYEDEVYTELRKRLPRPNTRVHTKRGPGTVLDTQVLCQLVKVRLDSDAIIAVPIDELLSPEQAAADKPTPPPKQPARDEADDANQRSAAPEAKAPAGADSTPSEQEKPRRKRRRRRKKRGDQDSGDNRFAGGNAAPS